MTDIDRLTWLAANQTNPKRRWTAAEKAALGQLFGKLTVAQIAAQLGRSENSVKTKIIQLGYRLTVDVIPTIGLSIEDLSENINIPVTAVYRHAARGLLKTQRIGKYQVASWQEIQRYKAWFSAYSADRQRILDSIQESTISKQEFMARAGLCETQATRYLQHGVVRAWKIPTPHYCYPNRDEWLVSESDTKRIIQERAAGRIKFPPSLVCSNAASSQLIREKRRAGLLGHGQKTGPRHCPIPGYLSISEMADKYHLSKDYLRQLAHKGLLKTRPYYVGKRTFHAIHKRTAAAFARRHKTRKTKR